MKHFGFIVVAGCLLAAGAQAQEPKPISTQAIYACAEIADDMERLACYDDSVGRLEAAEAAGEVTTISKAEVEEIERDSFGFSLPSIARNVLPKFGNDEGEKLQEVVFAVDSISRRSNDKIRITLENGQIWDQSDDKWVFYSKKRGVESAEIKRAALGSFKMKLDGGKAFRVKRVK